MRSSLAAAGLPLRLRRTLRPPSIDLPEAPGEIVCLCRSISRGEIEAACRQPTEPRTLDAIKRRSGATFGDCQGNLCGLDVARIVAAERGIRVSAVEKHRRGSWLWQAARPSPAAKARESRRRCRRGHDVVVIGLGLAGQAATAAATAAGASVVGIERRNGDTVVGLSPNGDGGWVVLVQSTSGTAEIATTAVIVTTGGLFRAARASFHRRWPAGRRDDE